MTRLGVPIVQNTDEGSLICPSCNGYTTHVELVQVAARVEDRDFNEIFVDAVTGEVRTHCTTPAPVGEHVREGRRHRITLTGYCEECGHDFALVFTQHKGDTFVEWATPTATVQR